MSVVDCRTSSVYGVLDVVVNDSLDSTAYVRFYRKLSTEEKLGKKHGPVGFFSDDVDVFWSTSSCFLASNQIAGLGKNMVLSM